jgi:hypothetical protein
MTRPLDQRQDRRYETVRAMLDGRYNGVIPITDEMV